MTVSDEARLRAAAERVVREYDEYGSATRAAQGCLAGALSQRPSHDEGVIAEVKELRELLTKANDASALDGWRVRDSHFYDWLTSERVHPDNVALIKKAVQSLPRLLTLIEGGGE